MGWKPALIAAHLHRSLVAGSVRALIASLALGGLVVARTQSLAAAMVLTVLGIVAARRPSTRAAIMSLGTLTCLGVPWIVSPLVAGIIWMVADRRRGILAWLYVGGQRVTPKVALVASLAGGVAGLIGSPFARTRANVTPIVFQIVPPHVALAAAGVVVLALANAIGEELLWRGALAEELRTLPAMAMYALQMSSFGLAHWHGLPGGVTGCVLTAAASGLFVWIHRRCGIVASVLAHLVADIAIFTAVLPMVLFTGWST